MKTLFAVLFLSLGLLAAPPAYSASEGIAAVVNDDAISVSDFQGRLRLIAASSGARSPDNLPDAVGQQVMNDLIEEQLMLQEAEKMELEITEAEIDQGFARIAAQNNVSPEEFAKMVRASGIPEATMRRQIRAQIAWGKVVQARLRPQVRISDMDIQSEIERLGQMTGRQQFLAAEIFLPVDDPAQDQEVEALSAQLVEDIRAGKAPFFKVAQQFSKAPGAAQGGDLGWVPQGQLPDPLDQALESMEKNSITPPIRSKQGYHIMFLRDRRVIEDEQIPSAEQVREKIGTERLQRLSRRYLMDLKASAFIENRLES